MSENEQDRLCPVCSKNLDERVLHNKIIDQCPDCRGIFFDSGELERIIHIVQLFQDVELEEREIETISHKEKQRSLICPHDHVPMKKREISEVTIDVCEECGGIWLDAGELTALKIVEQHIRDNLELYIRLGQEE